MWFFKTYGFKFFTAASVYCSVYSSGSDMITKHWNYNWDKSHGIHNDPQFEFKSNTLNIVKNQQPYYKLIIFIRHGQYHLNKKKSEEKVLTDIGWRQAYAAGCRLREMGIKIDRIIHSDLIRARQTTAGVLIGLENNVDNLFDSSEIVKLVLPDPSRLDDPKSCPIPQKSNEKDTISLVKSDSLMKKSMIDDPYTPYRNATFDCQLSRYLTEGPPPVAPEPATSSTKKSDPIRSTDGLRIDKGYQVHLHRQPITNQGIIAYNGTVSCPMDNCCANSKQYPLNAYIQCNCSCHRIVKHQPIETIVFIGHANVLRYWLCKLLQLPTEGWLRLSLGHGSISTLMITNDQFTSRHDPYTQQDKEGEGEGDNVDVSDAEDAELKYGSTVTLYRFGDVGHLPRELLTQ